jgi:hypothetical protein
MMYVSVAHRSRQIRLPVRLPVSLRVNGIPLGEGNVGRGRPVLWTRDVTGLSRELPNPVFSLSVAKSKSVRVSAVNRASRTHVIARCHFISRAAKMFGNVEQRESHRYSTSVD